MSPDTTVLDPAVLDMLQQLTQPGEPDVMAEVLRMFLSEVPPRLDRMRNASASGNIEEVHRAAHSLKGSAGNIGARAFQAVCSQLDEKSKAGDLAAVAPLVDAAGAEYRKVEAEIHRLIGA